MPSPTTLLLMGRFKISENGGGNEKKKWEVEIRFDDYDLNQNQIVQEFSPYYNKCNLFFI